MQQTKVAKKLVLAASFSVMFGGAAAPALADTLTDKLCDKGVLSEAECNELREADGARMSSSFKDGFKWKSNDGQHEIQLAGRVQLDYRSFDHEGTADTFDIRRAYLGVKGKMYKNWSFEATSTLDGGALEYGFLDYKWSDAARLRMGAFKYQFSFEEITSSRFTDFMERSFVNSWVPGKDVGLMLYGQPRKNVFTYALGCQRRRQEFQRSQRGGRRQGHYWPRRGEFRANGQLSERHSAHRWRLRYRDDRSR